MTDFDALCRPFPPEDIEWRVGQAGEKDGKPWAKVLAYITSRAIMDRLDDVCGPGNWATEFREGAGHLQAGLGIRIDDEWVWKWDGTGRLASSDGLSDADAGKGDFSNALKRVAVQWGIGRYLYRLPEGWAIVNANGRYYQPKSKKVNTPFRWDPPRLPEWAVPSGERDPIVAKMEALWLDATRLGIGGDDEKAKAGMDAIEIAISKGDVAALNKAHSWLEGAIATARNTGVAA